MPRPLLFGVHAFEHEIADPTVVDDLDTRVGDPRDAGQLVKDTAALVLPAPGRLHPLRIVGEVVRSAVGQRGDRALPGGQPGFQRLGDAGAGCRFARAQRVASEQHARPPRGPGVLFAGDSLGAGKPASGAGISKALESGLAAGECAIAALTNGGPDDFTNYAQRMEAAWGREYKRGRVFHKLAGIPRIANAGIKVIDNGRVRDFMLKRMYAKEQG